MKVSIFIPSFETGGVENNVILYSKILVENNYDVDVVYTRADKDKFALVDKRVNKVQIIPKIKIPSIHPRIVDSVNIIFEYYKYLKKNKKNVLVLSFQNSIIAILVCKLLNIQVIARVANHPNIVNVDGTLMTRFSNLLKNYIYRYATLIISNSKVTSKQIAINTKAKTDTIYNPSFSTKIVDMSKESIDDEVFNAIVGKKIISVGRLVKQKDFTTLIKAFDLVQNNLECNLIIIGDGEYKERLEQLVIKLNLQNKVYLLGYKQNPHKYIANSDLFVLSSLYEGLPNVLIEAIAVGTPSISTNCLSGPSEILLDGKGGDLVEVENIEELAKAIEKNLLNVEYAKEKHKIAYNSLDRFSYEKVQKNLLKLVDFYE